MRIISVALLAVLPVGVDLGLAGEGVPLLTLEDAVATAVQHNRRLAAADADVGVSAAELSQARSPRKPRLDLGETFSRTTNPALVFSNLLGQERFTEQNFDVEQLNRPDPLNNWQTTLSLAQPIYTGGAITNNIGAAELAYESAAARKERTRQEVVCDVIDGYTAAVLAERQLVVARESLETSQANVRLVQDLRQAGLVVESDLLRARVRVSEVRELLARAESAVAVGRARLNLVLGRELATPFGLPETIEVEQAPAEPLAALVEQAKRERADLKAAGIEVHAANRLTRASRSGHYPEVDFLGVAEANAEDFIGAEGTNWSLFVRARWNLYSGKSTRANVRVAREKQRKADEMRALLEQSVELEVTQAFHDLRAARQRLDQTAQAVRLAGESLRIVRDRYREGLTTLVELLDSETSLTRARTRNVGAKRDVLLARANLELATGRL